MNPAERREAATAYDDALSTLVGCRGLLTEPMTEGKLELLRKRLKASGGALMRCLAFVELADAEPPFIPLARAAPQAEARSGITDLAAHRSRRRPRP